MQAINGGKKRKENRILNQCLFSYDLLVSNVNAIQVSRNIQVNIQVVVS